MGSFVAKRTWPVLAAVTVGSLVACSALLDVGREQCASDSDCTARGGPFADSRCLGAVCVAMAADAGVDAAVDPRWSCIGNNPVPTPPPQITLSVTLTDFFLNMPVRSVRVIACPNSADPTCALPIQQPQTPDANGVVRFTIDTSHGPFTGYVIIDPLLSDGGVADLDASDDADKSVIWKSFYVPSRVYYINRTSDTKDQDFLLTFGEAKVFEDIFTQLAESNRGFIFGTAIDCNGQPAAGVSASLDVTDAGILQFYLQNGAPSLTLTSTDATGTAGFVNVLPGARTVSMRFASTQQPIGSANIYVLASTISYVEVGPANTP
jgi:hypothetical protein